MAQAHIAPLIKLVLPLANGMLSQAVAGSVCVCVFSVFSVCLCLSLFCLSVCLYFSPPPPLSLSECPVHSVQHDICVTSSHHTVDTASDGASRDVAAAALHTLATLCHTFPGSCKSSVGLIRKACQAAFLLDDESLEKVSVDHLLYSAKQHCSHSCSIPQLW